MGTPSPLVNFMPIILIGIIFYFFLIRPQQKQAKERQKMLAGLNKGDKVLTTGGIFGVINNIKGDELEVKIADNVKVTILRSAVASVVNPQQEASKETVTS